MSLVIDNNILYAGGGFTTAGGKESPNFAFCTLNGTVPVANSTFEKTLPPLVTREAGTGRIRMHLTDETVVDMCVYSLTGRMMYRVSEKMSAGEHRLQLSTSNLAKGSYVAQVKAENESMSWKMILDR